jgi:hypothetical protein
MSDEAAITETVEPTTFTEAEAQEPPDPQDEDAFFSRQAVIRRAVPFPEEAPQKDPGWANRVGTGGQVDYLEDLRTRQAAAFANDPQRLIKDAFIVLRDNTKLFDDVVADSHLGERARQLVAERLQPVRDGLETSEANQAVAALWKKMHLVEQTEEKAKGRVEEADQAYAAGLAEGNLDAMRKANARRRAAEDDLKSCGAVTQALNGQVRAAQDAVDAERSLALENAREALRREGIRDHEEGLRKLEQCLREHLPAAAFLGYLDEALRGR